MHRKKFSSLPVLLERTLSKEEEKYLEDYEPNSSPLRVDLIHKIISLAAKEFDSTQIANECVKEFKFKYLKKPFETTRTTVNRVIHDLNKNLSAMDVLKKRGKGAIELTQRSEKEIVETLIKYHNEMLEEFTYNNLLKLDKKIIDVIEKKSNFSNFLEKAKIEPDIHNNDFRWGNAKKSKNSIKEFILSIYVSDGPNNLNRSSVEKKQIQIPKNLLSFTDGLCQQNNCVGYLDGRALMMQSIRIFKSWENAVTFSLGISSEEFKDLIERKPHKRDLKEVLESFSSYIDSNKDWTVAGYASDCPKDHHALHNHKKKLIFFKELNEDVMKAAFFEVNFVKLKLDKEVFFHEMYDALEKLFYPRRIYDVDTRASARGRKYQDIFLNMLIKSGLKKNKDFQYEKYLDKKISKKHNHKKNSRVEFIFKDLLIDVKTTLSSSDPGVVDRVNRYLDFNKNLLIVTLRQKDQIKNFGNGEFRVMTVNEFIDNSEEFIKIKIPVEYKKDFLEI